MPAMDEDRLEPLSRWWHVLFLLAGIGIYLGFLLFFEGILSSVGLYLVVAGCYGLTLGGLLGFHPRLSDRMPRLAIAGLVAIGMAMVGLAADVLPTALSLIAGEPFELASPGWSEFARDLTLYATAAGLLIYGSASLRARSPSYAVGAILVAAGVSLLGFFEFGSLLSDLPSGVFVVSYPVLSASLLLVGVALRSCKPPHTGWEYYRDEPPSHSGSSGWINGYVRRGFDVDGSDSRTSPLSMETRLTINRFLYEGSGVVLLTAGSTLYRVAYPLVRLSGRILGRESASEQYIAEREYIIHHLRSYERQGLASEEGLVSFLLQVGFLLLFGFLGYWLASSMVIHSRIIEGFCGSRFGHGSSAPTPTA